MVRYTASSQGKHTPVAGWIALAVLTAFFVSPGLASGGTLTLEGSTMLSPLEKQWVRGFEKDHQTPRFRVISSGSGAGIRKVGDANVEIGTSDLFMTARMKRKYPALVSIPVAISGMIVLFNLPEMRPNETLNLNGHVLSDIYQGKIRFWNDPAIQSLNPGERLPNRKIVPVHRTDPSGTTFVLTDYLSRTSPDWSDIIGRDRAFHNLPGIGVRGSRTLIETIRRTPGSLGYAGLSWASQCGCPFAALQNRDGFFVKPSPSSFRSAALAAFTRPDFPYGFNRSIVWDIPGKEAYPAANFEYFLVNKKTDAETMRSIRMFLLWILGPGQKAAYTEKNGFASLPWPRSSGSLSRILQQLLQGNSFQVVSPG